MSVCECLGGGMMALGCGGWWLQARVFLGRGVWVGLCHRVRCGLMSTIAPTQVGKQRVARHGPCSTPNT